MEGSRVEHLLIIFKCNANQVLSIGSVCLFVIKNNYNEIFSFEFMFKLHVRCNYALEFHRQVQYLPAYVHTLLSYFSGSVNILLLLVK